MAYLCGLIAAIIGLTFMHVVDGQDTPLRPKMSESFSSEYTRVGLGTEQRGSIYRNFDEGKQFQVEYLAKQNGVVKTLTRVDLNTKYKYFEPYTFCSRASSLNFKIVPAWNWIEDARYVGLKRFNQKRVNVWAYNDTQNSDYVYNEIGVLTKDASHPVYHFKETSKSFEVTVFQTFVNHAPLPNKFDVPNIQCYDE